MRDIELEFKLRVADFKSWRRGFFKSKSDWAFLVEPPLVAFLDLPLCQPDVRSAHVFLSLPFPVVHA